MAISWLTSFLTSRRGSAARVRRSHPASASSHLNGLVNIVDKRDTAAGNGFGNSHGITEKIVTTESLCIFEWFLRAGIDSDTVMRPTALDIAARQKFFQLPDRSRSFNIENCCWRVLEGGKRACR
jgi:hypothetical protein